MPVIRCGEARRTQTPNAVMTTLASPTLGGARQALWRVDMTGGQAGPLHAFDVEQVWTVLGGGASVQLGGTTITIGAGDTIVLPAGEPRRVTADPAAGLSAIATAAAGALASAPDRADSIVPPWIA
jgi:quercetin dioxygenase-like cupin family protein